MLIAHSAVRIGMAVLAVAALASGSSGSANATVPGAANVPATKPPEPSGGYDLGRVTGVADQLPPGFTVTEIPRTTFTQEDVDKAGRMLTGVTVTVDPPQCNKRLQTSNAVAGTVFQGFEARGPQEVSVVAVRFPHMIPAVDPGCSHVTFTSQNARGTADALPGPAIADAETSAVKLHMDVEISGASQAIDELSYLAAISDKTAVVITSDSNPDLLADLLVKSVAALRQN